MDPSTFLTRSRSLAPGLAALFVATLQGIALAMPVAVNDSYTVNEDFTLNTESGPIISANFDTGGATTIPFTGNWDYLDRIENVNGSSQTYPVDGAARNWRSIAFDKATSTIGPWGTTTFPVQAGGIDAFPGAPNVLLGVGSAPNGQNLVTTYLFRNTFTVTAAQAAETVWRANLVADDGCVIYINGTEVARFNMPAGTVTTETLCPNGNETTYSDVALNVAGVIVTGLNTIAIELHQTMNTSSDVGIDLTLRAGDGASGGFVYQDDVFGTNQPTYANGVLNPTGGFVGAGLHITLGRVFRFLNPRATSGGFTRSFTLASPTTVNVSVRYRLTTSSGLDLGANPDYGEAILAVNGTRYGSAANMSLAHIEGPNGDSGWQTANYTIPLAAGNHTLLLAAYSNDTNRDDETVDVYYDDVVVTRSGGGTGGVLANDTVGANPVANLVTPPSSGVLNFPPSGVFTYTPPADFFGQVTFTYNVTDATGTSNTATVTITVTPVNDAPVAMNDTYAATEDIQLVVPAPGVLANDTDVEGSALTAVLATNSANGNVVLNANGSFTYTPTPNFFGTTTFTYRASDGQAQSAPATVTINVAGVPDAPTPLNDSYTIEQNNTLVVTQATAGGGGGGVTETIVPLGSIWKYNDTGTDLGTAWRAPAYNDSAWAAGPAELGYGDGDEVTVVNSGPPGNFYPTTYFRRTFNVANTAAISACTFWIRRDDGCVVFLNGTRIGISNLTGDPIYSTLASNAADDGNTEIEFAGINPALFVEGNNTIAVEIHQNTPTSTDITFELRMQVTRQLNLGLLANDTDPDGLPLTATLDTAPLNGMVSINPNGTFTYIPALNFKGTDTFTYLASNGTFTAQAMATITVTPGPNSIPVTQPDSYTLDEDTVFTRSATNGVLANDTDPDGDTLTARQKMPPSNGSLTLNPDGSFTYTPAANFFGTDSFTYAAFDGTVESPPETVTLNVTNTPDAPVALADVYFTNPGQTLTVSAATGVLANDYDPDNTAITAILVANVGAGTLNLSSNGGFTYTPANSTPGSVTFTYRASDGVLTSAITTVTIHLNAAPITGADSYAATEDIQLIVPAATGVLANDSDPESQPLTAVLADAPTKGTVSLNPNGSFVYTPHTDANGVDAFTYRASDGVRQSAPTTVTITIAAVNDAPTAVDDAYSAGVNQSLIIPEAEGVLANDIDPDSTALVASMVQVPTFGQVTLNPNGSFTYIPALDFLGDDTFVYRTSDGSLFSGPATVTISVGGGGEDVVFNEIMYHPGTGFPEPLNREFVELHNRGIFNADLSGWSIVTGVAFTFPQGTTLASGGYLVVAADVAAFQSAYPGVTNVVGGWSGTLSNNSNRLTLADATGKRYDTVSYASEGDWARRVRETTFNGWAWSTAADGGGASLELRNPSISNDNGQNWAVSTATGGTPGVANSVLTSNIAPIIKAVKHSPAVPRAIDTVLVSCELNDESAFGRLTATLHWRNATGTSPGAFTAVPMSWNARNGWFAPVPAQANLTVIEFYISATDGVATRSWPAATSEGQNANCQYLVSNEVMSTTAETCHLVLTGSENAAFNSVATSSDRQFNQTLIVVRGQETSIRYRSAMRIRGNSSRTYQFRPLRVNIPNDNDLNGWSRFNLNPRSSHLQYAGMRLAQASGLRVPDTIPVELRRNGVKSTTATGSTPDYGLWVRMEDLSGEMINSHWPLNKDGQVYKKGRPDRFWRATQAAPNNPNGLIDGWLKQNNSGANDWSDLQNFFSVWQTNALPHFPGSPTNDVSNSTQGTNTIGNWNSTGFSAAAMTNLDTVADLNQWARWFAFMTIIQSNETNISNGQDDDYACYFAPRTVGNTIQRRMELIPHDLDTIFGLGDSPIAFNARGLFDMTSDGDVFRPLLPLFGNNGTPGNAAFRTAYFTALRELLGGVFDADTTSNPNPPFHQFVDYHLGNWAPAANRTVIKNFMTQRRTYLLGLMAASAIPPTAGTANATVTSAPGALMIYEILANNVAAHSNGGVFPDAVELLNSGVSAVDLAGKSLTDNPLVKGKYIFPPGTTIPAGGILVVYADSLTATPGIHLGFGLNGGGDALYLYDTVASGQALLDSLVFGLQIADYTLGRTGASLNTWALCTPSIGAANTAVASLGSPGGVRINEWCGNADYRASNDFIELYNPSANPTALGGMVLTDDFVNHPTRGTMPPLSFIGPGRFVAFETKGSAATPGNALELPYNLGATFGSVALLGANGAMVDRVDTVSQFRDVSVGRVPDGSVTLSPLSLPSPGAPNAGLPAASANLLNYLRITEMMYNPAASGASEYLEFRNMSDRIGTPVTLDLSGVAFSAGITFTFAPGTTLAPGQHLVIVENPTAFQAQFPAVPVTGTYSGKLDNGGERVRFDIPGGGVSILDFTYKDSWFPSTDGGGFALQSVDATASPAQWDKKSGWQAALPNPGGSPPFGVSAGADVTGDVAIPVLLDGAVFLGTYAPNEVSVAWTLVSGPGPVTFTTANYQDANAIFTQPGVYTVRLTATSPGGSLSDTAQVTIDESFNDWATRTIAGAFAGQRGMNDDPDLDGYTNFVEWVTGSNPLVPGAGITVQIEGGHLVMHYTRSKTIPATIQLIPEIAWDLRTWYNGGTYLTQTLTGETASVLNLRAGEIGLIGSTGPHSALRLKVIMP